MPSCKHHSNRIISQYTANFWDRVHSPPVIAHTRHNAVFLKHSADLHRSLSFSRKWLLYKKGDTVLDQAPFYCSMFSRGNRDPSGINGFMLNELLAGSVALTAPALRRLQAVFWSSRNMPDELEARFLCEHP